MTSTCSCPPVCCAPTCSAPPQCCHPAGQNVQEHLRPAKKHYCCSADSQCQLCSQYPNKAELCWNYMRNKYIVDSLSCLFRITQFQVLATLFRLACDEIKPQWHYPRDRVWSVMENVRAPYTEVHDLRIYDSMHDRCGLPIDPLDRTNAYKVMRLIFMVPVLVAGQRDRLLNMLRQLNSRAVCPVNLEGLLQVVINLKLYQLVVDILENDARLRRFRGAREFWELCKLYQETSTAEDGAGVRKRRRKKNAKSKTKIISEKKPTRKNAAPPIFCTRRVVETEEPLDAGRAEETNANSRRSSMTSRRSSIQKPAQPMTQTRWIQAPAPTAGHLLPHSTPILGLRSLYLTW